MAKHHFTEEQLINDFPDYKLKEIVSYKNGGKSHFFSNGINAIVIDEEICNISKDKTVFDYSLITDKQNNYMYEHSHLYRFLGYKKKDINEFLNYKENNDKKIKLLGDRANYDLTSPLEYEFEKDFAEIYGEESIKYLEKEYCINDSNGDCYFIDYVINTKEGVMGIEENGICYHHPQIIGEELYRKQLFKQNTCSAQNMKLYRFSSQDCVFKERIVDDIRKYLGNKDAFIERGIVAQRSIKLYEHQKVSLEEIQNQRKNGIKVCLIVLPTASGKSMIVEQDMLRFQNECSNFKALILVPSVNIVDDWKQRIKDIEIKNVDVYTYSYMTRHFYDYTSDYYNYVVIDEAHHAVAPMLKRTIQYFEPDFLIGLTATDQRPDNQKLESIFGGYNTKLSLESAMEKGIIAKANVYRIETNIDLSEIRFNGKEYVNADLEKTIRVTSRNELIAQVLNEYFTSEETKNYQGVIFCVNRSHANEVAKVLNDYGLNAAVYTQDAKKPEEIMRNFKAHKIRFLCACNMISEGWDYPELRILVMARPTLSKVLYLQQIGRGLRKTSIKKNVFVIDVIDKYGMSLKACNMNSIFSNPYYVPFGDITKTDYQKGDMVVVDGIKETIERIIPVDISNFEKEYGDYLSVEQLARFYFVSTGTINSWVKKGQIKPTKEFVFGSKKVIMFSPDDAEKYRIQLNIKKHGDDTIKEDFFNFLEERDYTLSYKMPFILALIKYMNEIGDVQIDKIVEDYISFYQDRIDKGLIVDRNTCPYNNEYLKNKNYIKSSILTNPFEKFERKRFLYYSKDLNMISVNHALFNQMSESDWQRVINQMKVDLDDYYQKLR